METQTTRYSELAMDIIKMKCSTHQQKAYYG